MTLNDDWGEDVKREEPPEVAAKEAFRELLQTLGYATNGELIMFEAVAVKGDLSQPRE